MLTIPPFCPNAACRYHHPEAIPGSIRKKWYHKDGTYQPKHSSTPVQRFVCTNCGCRFSAQTFSLDYGVKTHLPYRLGVEGLEGLTHAVCAGIPGEKIRRLWKYYFTRRFFVTHLSLSESEWYCWYRCYATPLKHTAPWFPRYACM